MSDVSDPIEFDTAPDPGGCVIWLHGLGAHGADLVPVARALDLPGTLALRHMFPDAPWRAVTIAEGEVMRAWYDVRAEGGLRREDGAGVRDAQARIAALVDRERARGIRPGRIVLAGFSQGGAVALQTGLRYPERLAGIAALSSFLPLADTLPREAGAANRDVPIFMAHGTADPMIPLARGRASHDWLRELGYAVSWHEYAVGHAVCGPEIEDLAGWCRRAWDVA